MRLDASSPQVPVTVLMHGIVLVWSIKDALQWKIIKTQTNDNEAQKKPEKSVGRSSSFPFEECPALGRIRGVYTIFWYFADTLQSLEKHMRWTQVLTGLIRATVLKSSDTLVLFFACCAHQILETQKPSDGALYLREN